MTVLVGEAYSRLDPTAQRVMQALAIYRYPVPPAAVDYLLQPHVPGIDSGRVLGRLVNMQFVRRDAGRYYLHQVDRDYALSRIAEGDPGDRDAEVPPLTRFALRHRAAEWFKLSRKPREAWKTLDDLAAQLSEFELRCEGDDYDTAAAVLLEFDFDYLYLWGHYRLMTELHERLQGKIADPKLAQKQRRQPGLGLSPDGADSAGDQPLRAGSAAGTAAATTGRARACGLAISRTASPISGRMRAPSSISNKPWRSAAKSAIERANQSALGNLANRYAEIGQNARAVEYYEQALLIDREIESQEGEACNLINLGERYQDLGRPDEALRCHTEALAIARESAIA